MSFEVPPPPVKSYTPPVAQPVTHVVYPPPSAPPQAVKPTAPPMTYYAQQQQPGYTYAQMPYQQTAWVNAPYQPQMYPPSQQFQQRYVVATQPIPQQPQQNPGLGIAGGFLAGMVTADILDEITDP